MTDTKRFTYEETEALVLAYQENKSGAAEQLLIAFKEYMAQFVNLIKKGTISASRRGQRQFISLYISNPLTRANLHRFRRSRFAHNEIYKITNSIKGFFSKYSYEEIIQETALALLTLAKRYKSPDGKPRFHYYVDKTFAYQLHRQLRTLISDPVVFQAKNNQSFDSDEDADYLSQYIESDMDHSDEWIASMEASSIEDDMDEINDNWVNGLTCSDSFHTLSIFDRKIIKLYYIDELTDQQIANILGTCRATINRRRLATIAKLRGGTYV